MPLLFEIERQRNSVCNLLPDKQQRIRLRDFDVYFPHTVVAVEGSSDFEPLYFVLNGSPEAVNVVDFHVELHLTYVPARREDMDREIILLINGVFGCVHHGSKAQYLAEKPGCFRHVEGGDHRADGEGAGHGREFCFCERAGGVKPCG